MKRALVESRESFGVAVDCCWLAARHLPLAACQWPLVATHCPPCSFMEQEVNDQARGNDANELN